MLDRRMALALALLVSAGCVQDDAEEGMEGDTAAMDTLQQPAAGQLTDAQIMHVLTTANTADSSGGEMAQQKGSDAAVKAFGQRMVQDHGMANQQGQQLAQGASLTPEDNPMSQQLLQNHQQATQQLQGLTGAAFDRAYIDHEVQMHQTLLDALDQQLVNAAQNEQLKTHLQQIRSAVQSHLDQARGIQAQLGGGAPGAAQPSTGAGGAGAAPGTGGAPPTTTGH